MKKSKSLKILMTGGNSKLGKILSNEFIANNHRLTLTYNKNPIETNNLAESKKCDLTNVNDINSTILDLHKTNQKFDLLINNAASFSSDFSQGVFQEQNFTENFNVNLRAPMMMSELFQSKISSNNALIINFLDYCINDLPSAMQNNNLISYALSKNALGEFTKISALKYAPKVRVNGIAFGGVLKENREKENKFYHNSKNNPLNLKTEVSEIINTINFIIQNKSMTGQIINLDGGKSLSKLPYYE